MTMVEHIFEPPTSDPTERARRYLSLGDSSVEVLAEVIRRWQLSDLAWGHAAGLDETRQKSDILRELIAIEDAWNVPGKLGEGQIAKLMERRRTTMLKARVIL